MSRRRNALAVLLAAAFAVACLFIAVPDAGAKQNSFRSTAHGSPVKGPKRRANRPQGSCSQCHGIEDAGHASRTGGGMALFAPNDNNLCFYCHGTLSVNGTFPGGAPWARSTHATSARVVDGNPEPGRRVEANRCTNCHDPHGARDEKGLVIPALLHEREPAGCLRCHDGSRGADIRSETTRPFVHGMSARGTHQPPEGNDPDRYGVAPANNRHVSCSDCHNVHVAESDRTTPAAPEASLRLAGVSRVQVVNGAAGTLPTYRWAGADDTSPVNEYEVCFKCHSSWTKLSPRDENLALLTNPANASYHPIQAAGKNPGIRPEAFEPGWDAASLVRCTDCHASDNPRVRGPHASSYEYLLRRPAAVSEEPQTMQRGDLCFSCHAWAVYADPQADEAAHAASRFNGPASAGHVFHVAAKRVPCYACHETHGSARNPALIATDHRSRAMFSYTQSATGGTCNSACHEPATYTVNYPR